MLPGYERLSVGFGRVVLYDMYSSRNVCSVVYDLHHVIICITALRSNVAYTILRLSCPLPPLRRHLSSSRDRLAMSTAVVAGGLKETYTRTWVELTNRP
jgi:hypothetical protein